MDSFWYKANVKRFGFNNLHQDFDIMRNVVHTAMDAFRDNWSKENVYNEIFINVHSASLIWKYWVRVWHVEWLENVGFLRDQKSLLDFKGIYRDR